MGYTAAFDKDRDLGVIVVHGQVTLDLLRRMAEELTPQRTSDVVLVFRGLETSNLTSDEIRSYSEEAVERVQGKSSMRTCVVAEKPVLFGITRIFSTYAELGMGNEETNRFMPCKTLEQAADWLGADLEFLKSQVEYLENQALKN